MGGSRSIANASIEPDPGFMACFKDQQGIAVQAAICGVVRRRVPATQTGQQVGRTLYNELQQEDILSGVRFGLTH